MTTYTEPTINVTDWRGKTQTHTMESYQEAWKTGSIDEVRRLAMWQANEDDVVELERLQRELEEVRERVVRREFNRQYEKEHGHHVIDSPYIQQQLEEWSKL